jgi:heme exporter protein A
MDPIRNCDAPISGEPHIDKGFEAERAGDGLRAEGLAAFRGERLVFRDLSFHVAPGGALLLLGANGSGKSTLLRLLAGLLRPAAGTLHWRGEDVFADLATHATCVGYLGHQEAIKPGLTAAENLVFAASIGAQGGAQGAPAIAAALEALQLSRFADLPARLLSAGQRRRLALARLTLGGAKLWLLDEPTLGLDAASVAQLGRVVAQNREAGGAVVAATHLELPLPDAAVLDLSAE